jgi:hypothetical protein
VVSIMTSKNYDNFIVYWQIFSFSPCCRASWLVRVWSISYRQWLCWLTTTPWDWHPWVKEGSLSLSPSLSIFSCTSCVFSFPSDALSRLWLQCQWCGCHFRAGKTILKVNNIIIIIILYNMRQICYNYYDVYLLQVVLWPQDKASL